MTAPKILLLICSCVSYQDRRRRAVDAEGSFAKRQACRETWLANLPARVDYAFFLGAEVQPAGERDVWALLAPDTYRGLPQKTKAAFERALEHEGWDYIFKCDDDSFVCVDRLLELVDELHAEREPCLYSGVGDVQDIAHGGAGYLLPRKLVQLVVDDPLFNVNGPPYEDRQVTWSIRRAGWKLINDARLQVRMRLTPTPDNKQISCHEATPEDMRRLWAVLRNEENLKARKISPSSDAVPMTVHQWWAGACMPKAMQEWCDTVKAWAEGRGWSYHLWTQEETDRLFANEPATLILARCREALPASTTSGFASDWWRLRLLAEFGGIWLDSDYIVQDAKRLNAWQPTADIAIMGEGWKPEFPSIGCLWCNGKRGHDAARVIHEAANAAMQRILPLHAPDFAERFIQIARTDTGYSGIARRGIGPWRMREEFLPAMVKAGYCYEVMPLSVCCDKACGSNTALLHKGGAAWRETEADWKQREKRAKIVDFNTSLPPWQRPQSSFAGSQPRAGRGSAKPRLVQSEAPIDGFRIPSSVKRVVIFSNIPSFDPAKAEVKAGDFCIHCNKCVHVESLKNITGTTHVALVRHGQEKDTGEWHWFEPASTNGIRQVIHIEEAGMSSRRAWWRLYRVATGKCPTTGFIAWHLAQEAVASSVPIILAGFAPGERKGTPLWDGHAWSYEAEAYRKAGVQIIAP